MKIIIVEDNVFKRDEIIDILHEKNIDFQDFSYVGPALEYIFTNKEYISGVILDLGLQSSENSDDYSLDRGMDVIREFKDKGINIPIMINSSRTVKNTSKYCFIHSQRTKIDDYETIEKFITFLKSKEE